MQGYKNRTTNRTLLVMMPLYVHSQEEYTCDRIFNSISRNELSKYYKWDGKGYTKHYFEGDRRVCSKLGGGFTGRTEDDINDRIQPIEGEYEELFERQYQGMKETFGRCMEKFKDIKANAKIE